MRIGVPKEIKSNEHRVGLIPAAVRELTAQGHEVLIEAGAGAGSGFPDAAYLEAIAQALASTGGNPLGIDVQNMGHNNNLGRPARAEFLLAPGELLSAFSGLRVVAFEDGFEQPPAPGAPRFVQRLAAVRLPAAEAGAGAAAKIHRFPLQP
jgi:hypothetical protein